jgi:hypothetical protein
MRARSPRLAAVIARLLNGDELPSTEMEDPSLVPAYAVTQGGGSDEQYFIVGVQSTARKPARFGTDRSRGRPIARLLRSSFASSTRSTASSTACYARNGLVVASSRWSSVRECPRASW